MVSLVVEDGTGLSTANTYVSQADATIYHGKHLYATDWTSASSANMNIALTMATRMIDDHFSFEGKKVSDSQALEFPRHDIKDRSGYLIDATTIPTALKNATAEYARWLIQSDRSAEEGETGFKNLQVGSLSLTPDPGDRKSTIPDIVMKMLAPFGRPFGGMTAKVTR
tara:strand:- start:676 stop:1179 length:504 start_codon:yes stop_codon:yes gene_type:complete